MANETIQSLNLFETNWMMVVRISYKHMQTYTFSLLHTEKKREYSKGEIEREMK